MANFPLTTPDMAFVFADSAGRVLVSRGPRSRFYAASTIKLAVLLAAGYRIHEGELALDQDFPATRTFRGADGGDFTLTGDHLDPEFPAPGARVSVADLLLGMIARSSNEATNIVIRAVGLEAIAEIVAEAGLRDTRVDRLIGDDAASARGLTNETSPADLVRLLRATTSGRVGHREPLPPETVRFFHTILEQQRTAPIGEALPPGRRWGSKSGEVPGYRHDVAFIGDPDSPDCRYLAVCTRGYEQDAADAAIRALVAALGLTRERSEAPTYRR